MGNRSKHIKIIKLRDQQHWETPIHNPTSNLCINSLFIHTPVCLKSYSFLDQSLYTVVCRILSTGWSRCDPAGDKMFAIYVFWSNDRVVTCVIAWSHCGGDLFQKLWLDLPIALIMTFEKIRAFKNDEIIFPKKLIFQEKNIKADQNSVSFTTKKWPCKNAYLFNWRRSLCVSID